MKKILATLWMAGCVLTASAQESGYKLPSKVIADLANAELPPSALISPNNQWMLMMQEIPYMTLEELARSEYKLAGTRVTDIFGPSRREGCSSISLLEVSTGKSYAVQGLPKGANILEAEWSPNGTHIALTIRESNGIYLWMMNVADKTARQISKRRMNRTASMPGPLRGATPSIDAAWMNDTTLIVPVVPEGVGAIPAEPKTPKSPVTQANEGKSAPARTYQDMLKNAYDEALYAYFFTTQLMQITPHTEKAIGKPAIYDNFELSPDKSLLLVSTIQTPFSYVLPARSFPHTYEVWTPAGELVKKIANRPLNQEFMGYDTTSPYPRNYGWRADKPATLYWVEALDGGNPKKNKTEYKDAIYEWVAPFTADMQLLLKTAERCGRITWCDDSFALVSEMSRAKRKTWTYSFKPGHQDSRKVIFEISSDDNYANPGQPILTKGPYGNKVLYTDAKHNVLLMRSQGASPEGDMPYLSSYNIAKKENEIIWRCAAPYYETILSVANPKRVEFITSRQSVTSPVNYFMHQGKKVRALTHYANPYPQLEGLQKKKLHYKREDGLDLSADLYLPVGYNAERDGRLPVLMWAYPREYRSKEDAAQVRGSKYMFPTFSYRAPFYWIAEGYAVMLNVEMPIVGTETTEPNDDFQHQLVMNAEAAAKAAHDCGAVDTTRMAVGGHSYGGFMTANLLVHTKLFKAGLAESGAYNRTLTPFGFQTETRTYWEAMDIYTKMSPFTYANQLNGAILLIHGEADNNTGTFPIQSERLYAAFKGHGGVTKLVLLPCESHSYSARESVLHLLYEEGAWLDKYVKNAGKNK